VQGARLCRLDGNLRQGGTHGRGIHEVGFTVDASCGVVCQIIFYCFFKQFLGYLVTKTINFCFSITQTFGLTLPEHKVLIKGPMVSYCKFFLSITDHVLT